MVERIRAEARQRTMSVAAAIGLLRIRCAWLIQDAIDQLLLGSTETEDPQTAHAVRQSAYAAWQYSHVLLRHATAPAAADSTTNHMVDQNTEDLVRALEDEMHPNWLGSASPLVLTRRN